MMDEAWQKVPLHFRYVGSFPVFDTVGELIELLKELPGHLPIRGKWGEVACVKCVNFGTEEPYLCIEEVDEDEDE